MARAASGLGTYQTKRDFSVTHEPQGISRPEIPPPMFVVQRHAARRLHFDVRLEVDGVLKSWAVPKGPSHDPTVKRLAVMTEDHPLDYADFEGVIPQGAYGGGTVVVWDRGRFAPLDEAHRPLDPDDPEVDVDAVMRAGLAAGRLRFLLVGERLRGMWSLVRMQRGGKGTGRGEDAPWLLIKMRDAYVGSDPEELSDTSVLTGRSVRDVVAQHGTPAQVARRIARERRLGAASARGASAGSGTAAGNGAGVDAS